MNAWWKTGTIYQIYPRSFQDSNADGIGDLRGITSRLDYLAELGVDALWLSPIFPSPMHDFGYDVADYCDIHPIFGTMRDFEELLEQTHARGMKLLLDLVPNHTSDEHPWFLESRSSRSSAKRDWYIWADPGPGSTPGNRVPPNNWISFFGGPAWTYDEQSGQFYLHQFDPHQPELNYRHPDVLPAMLDVMRFWLAKGVDGFRVDVIWLLLKDELLRDEPLDPDWNGTDPHQRLLHIHTQNLPGTHDIIRSMRQVVDAYSTERERVLIGEIYLPPAKLVEYYGPDGDECHMPYNFQLILLPWEAQIVRREVDAYEALVHERGWPNWVLGNHDQHRVATRLGRAQSRVAHMLLLTLRGTPTIYYGDEIGMVNVPIPLEHVQDPAARRQPEIADRAGRDPERTPMQWDDSPNGGFSASGVTTWLPVASDASEWNVAQQTQDRSSMHWLIRTLLRLRRSEPAFQLGGYQSTDARNAPEGVFSFLRSGDGKRFLVVLNFTASPFTLDFSQLGTAASVLVSTHLDRSGRVDLAVLELRGDEGVVLSF